PYETIGRWKTNEREGRAQTESVAWAQRSCSALSDSILRQIANAPTPARTKRNSFFTANLRVTFGPDNAPAADVKVTSAPSRPRPVRTRRPGARLTANRAREHAMFIDGIDNIDEADATGDLAT